MAETSINITLTIQDIYKILCPECKEKIEAIIKDKLAGAMIRKALEGKG